MKCPVDGATLLMSDRQGVEIDYCPECRGVWLDRGELDKLVQRGDDRDERDGRDRRDDDWDDDRRRSWSPPPQQYQQQPPYKGKKKKGWLSEMFEFD